MITAPAPAEAEIPVRYEVAGQPIEIEKVNRFARRMLVSQTAKLRKKFAHLRGVVDDQGRSATIVIRQPKAGVPSVECVIEYPEGIQELVPDSEKAVRIS